MQKMDFLDFYMPEFQIKIGGNDQRKLNGAVISLDIDESLESSSMFTLNINEGWNFKKQAFEWLDSPLLSPVSGKDVEIYVRYANRAKKSKEPLITGKITALNPSFPSSGIPSLSVQGYDHSFCMQKSVVKEKRTFDKEDNYGNVAKTIASDNNLGNGDIDSTVKPCEKITQNPNESDYNFLKRLAGRIGYEFFIRNKKLYFRNPRDNKGHDMTLTWGKELLSFNPRLSTAGVTAKVTVKGHNPENPKKPIEGTATLNDINLEDTQVKNVLESIAICNKVEATSSEYYLPVCNNNDANHLAKSLLRKSNNNLIEGSFECIGMPEIRPGMNVQIEGIGDKFSGKYYIKNVKHSIGDGYRVSCGVRRGI